MGIYTRTPLVLQVVLLEDLAAHFKMKTQEVIDRIAVLQVHGHQSYINVIYLPPNIDNNNRMVCSNFGHSV